MKTLTLITLLIFAGCAEPKEHREMREAFEKIDSIQRQTSIQTDSIHSKVLRMDSLFKTIYEADKKKN